MVGITPKTQGNLTLRRINHCLTVSILSVTVTDIAGNTKTSAELKIEIDTQVQIGVLR